MPLLIPLLSSGCQSLYAAIDIVKGSALVIAISAVVVAWNNFRRGNTAIIKMVSVGNSGRHARGINNEQPFSEFDVEIRNIGIPLKNPSLSFGGSTKGGWINLPLQRFCGDKKMSSEGTLEKGMIAKYAIRSFEMDSTARIMVSSLVDPEAENVSLGVFSDGYLVKRFYLPSSGIKRWCKRKWNRIAWTVNNWFAYDIKKWETKYHHRPTILPIFNDPFWHLELFSGEVQKRLLPITPTPLFGSGEVKAA